MDTVLFNSLVEIVAEDFNNIGTYTEDAFKNVISDFLNTGNAVSGLTVSAEAVPDMTVYFTPGRLYQSGMLGVQETNSLPLVIGAAPATGKRIDRVCIQYSKIQDTPETRNALTDVSTRQTTQEVVKTRNHGGITAIVVSGTANSNPAPPAIPAGYVSLAQVVVNAEASYVQQTDIIDDRPTIVSLLSHAHSGGNDGQKIDWSSIKNKPKVATVDDVATFFDGTNGHKHDGTAGNGPKLSASNIANSSIGALDTTDVQSTLAAIYTEATSKGGMVATRNTVVTGPVSIRGTANVLRDRYGDNICVGGAPISGGDFSTVTAAANAFDEKSAGTPYSSGMIGVDWCSSQVGAAIIGTAYIGYKFSSSRHIRKLRYYNHGDTNPSNNRNISSAKIQNSADGITWNDVTIVTLLTTPSIAQNIILPASSACAYWRVLANSNTVSSVAWGLMELEMYELLNSELTNSDIVIQDNALFCLAAGFDITKKQQVDYYEATQQMSLTLAAADMYTVPLSYTDDLCNGGTAISGGDNGTNTAVKCFDNDTTTSWNSSQLTPNLLGLAYIGYKFATTKAIRKIMINSHATYGYNVLSVKVQYSDNGTTWSDAGTCYQTYGINYVTVPPVGAHQYWRLLANSAGRLDATTGNCWILQKVEMFEALQTYYIYTTRDANGNLSIGSTRNKPRTVKPVMVATAAQGHYTADLCIGGTAISSGDYNGQGKDGAFDDNTITNWGSTNNAVNGVAFIGYNFGTGQAKKVRKLNLMQSPTASCNISMADLQYSDDGTSWTTAHSPALPTGYNGQWYPILIPDVGTHQYWRLLAKSTVSGVGWSVHELEMMEYVDPLAVSTTQTDDNTYTDNLCIGGAAISGGDRTNQTYSEAKENAFDGKVGYGGSWWSSIQSGSSTTNAAYIGYDFGVARHIRKVGINITSITTPPTSFKIQRSSDGTTWYDVLPVSSVVLGPMTYYLPVSAVARYWRVLATGATGGSEPFTVMEITMHEVSTDVNLYDPLSGISKHYDGSTWDNVVRVFVGEAVVDSAGNIVNYTTYPYNKAKLKALPAEDSDDVVTLGQFPNSISYNGYQKLPGGLIIQWGNISNSANDLVTILPIAFPTAFYNVIVCIGYTAGSGVVGSVVASPNSLSAFTSRESNSALGGYYIAIGK